MPLYRRIDFLENCMEKKKKERRAKRYENGRNALDDAFR